MPPQYRGHLAVANLEAGFRSDNRAAFRAVFRQFTLLCRELKQNFRVGYLATFAFGSRRTFGARLPA
jgi:hypothetical protein